MPVSTHKDRNSYLITNTNSGSPISEAYRALRTNITFSSIDTDLKKIVVTSSIQSEGKSTTIANLAVVYAQENKRVLIIDADLRKPSLHQYFVRSNRHGLTNILAQQLKPADAILETDIPNVSLLTAGPNPPNPAELLSSSKMQQLLEQLSDEFDLILIDSPPTLAFTDAQILSAISDGVLFVIQHGKVKRQIAKKALLNLEHVKAKVLGIVLNDKPTSKKEVFSYSY
ncbi:CpsD/CapB family tyrosine-protein kinase [Paenibacillus sp. SI8]|uniref:CpsD/CapB family tyrosine-protein kinase n=1 Tax=unclassified Paenibacillus TaxID=185978 RepID=UPI003467E002